MDAAVRDALARLEAAYPGRIHSAYIEGSYADHSGIPTSDLDLTVVFKDCFLDSVEVAGAARVARDAARSGWPELDVTIVDEAGLAVGVPPMLKLASQHLFGQDVVAELPLLPIDKWARERMHAAYWLLVKVFERPFTVSLPITYPQPGDEFYGYVNRCVRLPDGTAVPSTRNLLRVTGWIATALVAYQAQRYVTSKRDCASAYGEYIGDEWTELLTDVYRLCRTEWQYLVPEEPERRMLLRNLCRHVLGFENHFIQEYRGFLIHELQSGDEDAVSSTQRLLGEIPMQDHDIARAIASME